MRIPLSHYQILTIFLYLYILSNLSLYLFYFSLLPPLPTFLLSFNLLILLIFSFFECLLNSPLPCLLGEVFTSLCLLLNLPLLHTRLFVCRNIYLYCQAAFRPHVCACFIIIIIIFEGGGASCLSGGMSVCFNVSMPMSLLNHISIICFLLYLSDSMLIAHIILFTFHSFC